MVFAFYLALWYGKKWLEEFCIYLPFFHLIIVTKQKDQLVTIFIQRVNQYHVMFREVCSEKTSLLIQTFWEISSVKVAL